MAIPRFYKSESRFQRIHHNLKHHPCPHCDQIGTLNLHGYLKGYDDQQGNNKVIRGHRVFCSNRGRRQGCGQTFSVMCSTQFKKFIITTNTLWSFLKQILLGLNTFQAFHSMQSRFKTSMAYRLIRIITLNQPRIRTLLFNKYPAPKHAKKFTPLIATIRHLQSAFSHHDDPLSAFQIHFQTPFI